MIDSLIPHRGRWKLIDRLLEHHDTSATAEFEFTEAFAEGHFPDRLVVPGVALVEGLAQTMLCLSRLVEPDSGSTYFLAGLDRVRFRAPVFPPATVRFVVEIRERRGNLTQAVGTATWDGRKVCTARLTGAALDEVTSLSQGE